jgi:uncharacterized Fe-S cluster protein YjdI
VAGAGTGIAPAPAGNTSRALPDVERVAGAAIEVRFGARRCSHARHGAAGAPIVFLANGQDPWMHPDTMPAERRADIAHGSPSGTFRDRRLDGPPRKPVPPVNPAAVCDAGPQGSRGELHIEAPRSATVRRCTAAAPRGTSPTATARTSGSACGTDGREGLVAGPRAAPGRPFKNRHLQRPPQAVSPAWRVGPRAPPAAAAALR